MTSCDRVRALLEEQGLEALRSDDDARAHAADCELCFAFVEALGQLDDALAALPPIDAPDALVERVLAAPKPAPAVPAPLPRRWARWAYSLGGVAAVLLVGIFSSTLLLTARDSERAFVMVQNAPAGGEVQAEIEARKAGKSDKLARRGAKDQDELREEPGYFKHSAPVADPNGARSLHWRPDEAQEQGDLSGSFARGESGRFGELSAKGKEAPTNLAIVAPKPQANTPPSLLPPPPPPPPLQPTAPRAQEVEVDGKKLENRTAFAVDVTVDREKTERENAAPADIPVGGLGSKSGERAQNEITVGLDGYRDTIDTLDHGVAISLGPSLLPRRDALEGLTFQPAEGYWQNTYVPGDPTFRFLANRLTGEGIEDQARPYDQPFDAPKGAALAVSMASDRAAVEGPSRVLLQIGLKGALEHAHRRPAMNLAVVVDASGPLDVETAKAIRATALSFVRHKVAGDRMSLLVAGRAGAPAVLPQRFEYGTVAVALQAALAEPSGEGEPLTTTEALRRAIEMVAGADDETAPLGASAVVMIVPRAFGIEVERLADLAHQSAVAGIVVSTIGVGPSAVLPELDRIALSGQGNRRMLGDASEAEKAVDRELAAVGRVVARAVRLRIRLAAGVKLVDVLGSRRLDVRESIRAKEAEKSIDLRLSKHLGIEADRGEDEDGIEILIPSYYADDEHPILLDVVVPGPGPVADVQVRYKDLVYLKNGVARARLELKRGRAPRGPMQMSVLKNLVARRIADDLADASRRLAHEDVDGSRATLSATLVAVSELKQLLPQDPELQRDQEMLTRYRDTIAEPDQELIDSMAFASKAKILPAPLTSQR